MTLFEWIELGKIVDSRGVLVAIEGGTSVPFDIMQIHYLYGLQADQPRGFHAHPSHFEVAICVSGSCRMILDNGEFRDEGLLNDPDRGVLVREMVWHEFHDFSPDCVLLVLASAHYASANYIRDYEQFRNSVRNKELVK